MIGARGTKGNEIPDLEVKFKQFSVWVKVRQSFASVNRPPHRMFS